MAFAERFGEDDWNAVARAPFDAATAVVLADPGGLVGAAKEGGALAGAMRDAAGGASGALVDELIDHIRQHRPSPSKLGLKHHSRGGARRLHRIDDAGRRDRRLEGPG